MKKDDVENLRDFLDNLPLKPCSIKPDQRLCEICKKINREVAESCLFGFGIKHDKEKQRIKIAINETQENRGDDEKTTVTSPRPDENTPLGILLIVTFWVLLGALILTVSFRFPSVCSTVLVLIGCFCIIESWGLLGMKKWALIIAFIISALILTALLINTSSIFIYGIMYGMLLGLPIIFLLILISQIAIMWYVYRYIK
jgi:hypothetical protein